MPTIDFEPTELRGRALYVSHKEASRLVEVKLETEDGEFYNLCLPTWLVVSAIVGTTIRVKWLDDGAFEIEVLEVRKE